MLCVGDSREIFLMFVVGCVFVQYCVCVYVWVVDSLDGPTVEQVSEYGAK